MLEGIEGGFDTSDTSVKISCGSGAVGGQPNSNDDHGYLERVHGPIAKLILARYHQFIDGQTLKSYVASNERDAQIFKQKVGPADIPVITKKPSNKVYSQITDNLTDSGKDAINDINPNLLNFRECFFFLCVAQQHNLIQSVDEMPVDRTPTDDFNEVVNIQRYDFSESQDGKSYCDAKIAHMRPKLRKYVSKGATYHVLTKALDDGESVLGCHIAHVVIPQPADQFSLHRKIKRITKISNVQFQRV
ncbi:unnamed protein product [Mytilus edulis]|uniref:Uncharacterized protein n=1 Tax=Mytilus edulis TaxID=6550 RepID=A0A8S3VQL5_MYTED|nr:unnamed protein product [Mytilus edulis]